MLKKNKLFKTIFKTIKGIVSVFVLAIVGVIFVQRITNNEVALFGYSIFTVVSESMVPEYNVGDMIVAKRVGEDSIEIDDDVVYLGEKGILADKIVTHRVVKIEEEDDEKIFHTKGIANSAIDPAIDYDQIYGVVLRRSVILSFLSHLINNKVIFFFLLFIPFCLVVFFEILSIIKEKNELENSGE